jgi:PPIC-type PPIASE domain
MKPATLIIRTTQSAGFAAAVAMIFFAPVAALAQTAAPPRAQAPAKPKPAATAVEQSVPAAPQGLAASTSSGTGDVVARVGGINVSAEDVRAHIAALGPREQDALAKDPALLSQAVRMLLANRLVLQELTAKKWDQQPSVTAQLERVREGALVEFYLQSVSTPPANFPSDEELQKVYDANRNAMQMPRQFELAQIFVASPKDADKAAEEKAKQALDDVMRKLKAPGADFAAIATAVNGAKDGGNRRKPDPLRDPDAGHGAREERGVGADQAR